MDNNPGVGMAGQQIGAELKRQAGAPLSQGPANKWSVDSSDVTKLKTEIHGVVTEVTALEGAISSLVTVLKNAAPQLAMLGGGKAGSGASGGAGLTVAGFGTGGGGGPSGNTNTTAPVSGGSSGGSMFGKAASVLSFGALGETFAGAAGAINSYGARTGPPGMASNLMSSQSQAVFGQGPNTTMASRAQAGVGSLSYADMAAGQSVEMANNMLWTPTGSKNQKNKFGFEAAAQKIVPGMGNAGSAQWASTLASNGAMTVANRYLGSGQGILVNPNGSMNNASTTMANLMKVIDQGQTGTPAQLKAMAKNNSTWNQVVGNFGTGTALNLSEGEITAMRQYAAAGGSVSGAEKAQAGTVAASSLRKTTATTRRDQAGYQDSVGVRNTANNLSADANNAGANVLQDQPWIGALGTAFGKVTSAALKTASSLLVIEEALAAAKILLGGKKALGEGETGVKDAGGVLSKVLGMFGGGKSSPQIGAPSVGGSSGAVSVVAATRSSAVNGTTAFSFAPDSGLLVTLTDSTISNLAKAIGSDISSSGKTTPKKTTKSTTKKNPFKGLTKVSSTLPGGDIPPRSGGPPGGPDSGGILGDLEGGLGDLGDLPIGDPPTGAITTAGLSSTMKKRVTAMMTANPNVKISSGKRSSAQQAYLYAAKGGKGVARPGMSTHQSGQAADLGPSSQFGWIAANASKFGLSRPDPVGEPWHVQAMGDPSPGSGVTGQQVVTTAAGQEGVNYVYGGETPNKAFDCSGLVQWVFAQLGISLPRTSEAQASAGTAVSGLAAAQPGDLILYNEPGEGPNSHVAIYIGGGKQIAAPHTGTTVQVQGVDTAHLSCIRRVVGGGAGQSVATAAQSAVGSPSNDASSHAVTTGGASGINSSFLASIGGSWLSNGMGGPSNQVLGSAAVTGANASVNTTSTSSSGTSTGNTLSTTPTATGSLSAKSVYDLAIAAGLSPAAAQIATAVAKVESGFNPQAVDHDSNGTTDYGLWQINSVHGVGTNMYNPSAAATEMAKLTNKGANWGPWAPDFGSSNYGGNPQVGGKVEAALQSLGFMGDPVGSGTGGAAIVTGGMGGLGSGSSRGRMGSGGASAMGSGPITLNMPVQVVGASQADAAMLVNMVMVELQRQAGIDAMSGS